MSEVRITGNDILLVQCISGLMPYAETSKMAGQSYRRYSYGGKVFISNDETFYTSLEKGGVNTITLAVNEEDKLSLTGYITFAKMIGLKRNNLMIEALTIESFTPGEVALSELIG